jgi:hypothetical protein
MASEHSRFERLLQSASANQRRQLALASSANKMDKSPSKLLRGVLYSGAFGLFVSSIYAALGLAGVVDSMGAARLVLVFAWFCAVGGVLVSELLWGKSRRSKIVAVLCTAVIAAIFLTSVERWIVSYRIAHAVPSPPPTATPKPPEIAKTPIQPTPCVPLANFRGGSISGGVVGVWIDGACTNFDSTDIKDNDLNILTTPATDPERFLQELAKKQKKKAKQK